MRKNDKLMRRIAKKCASQFDYILAESNHKAGDMMLKRLYQLTGVYRDLGKIYLADKTILEWGHLSGEVPPNIPFGTVVELSIQYEERDYLNGSESIIWATYDLRQAEIIRDALLTQRISCEIKNESLKTSKLHLLHVSNAEDIQSAIDFVWREKSGMRLKPDWVYPAGTENESFNKWINGI